MYQKHFIDLKITIPATVLFLIIFLLNFVGSFSIVRGGVISLLEEQFISVKNISQDLSNIGFVFENAGSIVSENESLNEDIRELEEENARLRKQIEDVEYLYERGLADFDPEYPLIAVRLVSQDPFDSKKMIINKGSSSNIDTGDPLVDGEYLLGRVERVFDNYAEVRLIGDENFDLGVITLGTNTRGKLNSDLNGNLLVDEILNDSEVGTGDVFVTEGKDGNFPYGLVIGRVDRVVGSPADPTKSVLLSQRVDFLNIEKAFVIKFK